MSADLISVCEYFKKASVKKMLRKAIDSGKVEAEIVDLNTTQQLGKYEDATGTKLADIGGEYSLNTQIIKGVSKEKVNLKDTGEYWDSFTVDSTANGDFDINSDPIKDGKSLEIRYGKNLEGLNDRNYKKALDIIEDKIFENIQNDLQ